VKKGLKLNQALGCVDFMPTVLPLMGFKSPRTVQGRDASSLFRGIGKTQWNDFAVLRATNGRGWIAAVDKDLKLVISSNDQPWLFDRNVDPNELNNHFGKPQYRNRVRSFARQLLAYGREFNDASLEDDAFGSQIKKLAE